MKIKTAAKFLVGVLFLINLVVIALGYSWMKSYDTFQKQWLQYSDNVEHKAALIGLMKDAMGFGGMVHNLKNYMHRGDTENLLKVYQNLHELSIVLMAYRNLPYSELENQQLQSIELFAEDYRQTTMVFELRKIHGDASIYDEPAVFSNQNNAIKALKALNRLIAKSRRDNIKMIEQRMELLDHRSMLIGVSISLMLFGLAIYYLWFISRRIVEPVNNLLGAFESIDVGKSVGDRLPIATLGSRTELDELAISGNRFLDVVETQFEHLIAAQAKATESKQRVSAILNSTAEGIVTIAHTGEIMSFNTKCEEIFGYKAGQVIGQNVNCLMRPQEKQAHQKYVDNAQFNEKKIINANRELWGQRRDGSVFPMELTVSRVELVQQTCYIGILHDISVRRANEQKLLAAKVEAEKANQAKSQFLSAMSHELRTPLNAILGFSQLLLFNRQDVLSPIQQSNTEQILQAGQHLLSLINDILDLTKIESGNLEIEFERVDIRQVVNECLELVEQQAKAAQVELIDHISCNSDIQLYANFVRTKQILLNLLTNGIKYNQSGGKVYIRCKTVENAFLRIEIEDTGVGIDEQNYQNVFEPFVRFDKRATEIEGTGIGLSVCASLVEAMNGRLDFSSQLGQGSIFYVDLPIYLDSPEIENTPASNGYQMPENIGCANKTLLYIEDSPANMQLMEVLINDISQMRFIGAFNAEKGMHLVQHEAIDVIFMDINLPGIGGIEALEMLQADSKTRNIPVVAISAAASNEEIQLGMNAGFFSYLTKPLKVGNVAEVLRKALL